MAKVPAEVVEGIREEGGAPDERLSALYAFAKAVVRERGWPGDDEVDRFLGVGYTRENFPEVVLVVSLKTLSNDINHLAGTPLDARLEQFASSAPQAA